jgi:signal transduction histidine kinase
MPGAKAHDAGKAALGDGRDSGDTGLRRHSAGNLHKPSFSLRDLIPPLLACAAFSPSRAVAAGTVPFSQPVFGAGDVIQLAMFAGVMGAAMFSAIWVIRERARIADENEELRTKVADLNAALQRNDALLNLKDQRLIVWTTEARRPELVGGLQNMAGVPEERSAFLAFGRWLAPRSAATLEKGIGALREKGEPFDLVVETQAGGFLEVQGRRPTGHAVVRFLSLTRNQTEHARLQVAHRHLLGEHALLVGLVNALDMPFWLRSAEGRLFWVNKAYVHSVDAPDAETAVNEAREFLGTQAREAIAKRHLAQPVFSQTLSTVVGGDRRYFDVTEFAGEAGTAGVAIDRSEIEGLKEEFERTLRSHSDTLDQLTTAVAIFDPKQKLRFFNQAFQKLWSLDHSFLASAPDNALFLDRLRSEGKLAEQPEWRRWKENLLSAYRSMEPAEHWWHLPDGRTIRVIAAPQPNGGVTWVFENLTERMDLESRYNTAVRVQGETLDHLAEGVAVFGPDGRVRLSNPAFSRLWGLPEGFLGPTTHISEIRAFCDTLAEDSPWGQFVAAATGFDEERRDRHGQADLLNGTVLHYAVVYLPNGQVMMTFVDVTDSVNIERALKEKNEALERADQLKNDFVQHVNYELRSPLTNIIGFTELMTLDSTGPLNARQRDYIDHISSSSSVLLTIVNDILDLATVDAGVMELDIGDVPIRQTVEAAAELVGERLREHSIKLRLDLSSAPQTFRADGNRVRQILFNLLANAANYAPEHSTVMLAGRLEGDTVEFSVHDDGPGMPPEILDTVFRRFEPRTNGGRRRGAGLGLSIVKGFVELHRGSVEIDSGKGRGTTVICRFPLSPESYRTAAE